MSASQLSLFTAPAHLARRRDPVTSHHAAQRVEDFSASHDGQILTALRAAGRDGLIKDELAARTGLTDIQVARRLSSLEERLRVYRVKIAIEGTSEFKFATRTNVRGRECCIWRMGPKVSA